MQAPTAKKPARYTVHSSDVLSDNRVNISEEGSEQVIWYKERFLADEEIIEHIMDNATSTLLWTVHKPLRGWYLRLRAPSFPPTSFIALLPVPSSSPYHTPAALIFSCRTNAPVSLPSEPTTSKSSLDSEATLSEQPAASPSHTYPPPASPPSVSISPPSPSSIHSKLDAPPTPRVRSRSQVTQFILTPHSHPVIPKAAEGGVLTRAFRAIKNNTPAHSNSFTLSPLPPMAPAAVPVPPTAAKPHHPHLHHTDLPPAPTPLLTFHDTTPVYAVASASGVLEFDAEDLAELGIDVTFWIAVALTYLEFLGDRESYLAAVTD
ncbi:hypothetical protein FA95DRAFT_1526240 [Auriscalpium vulgare]|uniref:Uncharacterized protein n=1 Tax=Auriscalpium vulgare TaxID=40419 RepID=A0ACB8RCI8_9AGAM|nr:hypothetical protein FA95DRAFT_1526240 [Auriscalpium vulgare]